MSSETTNVIRNLSQKELKLALDKISVRFVFFCFFFLGGGGGRVEKRKKTSFSRSMLIITILWANSADDKLMISLLFYPENWI